MNEFTAKKLGEVLAFCRSGVDTFTKGEPALSQTLTPERVLEVVEILNEQGQKIDAIVQSSDVGDITFPKADKTYAKLNGMRDTYVGDEWANPAELLEWLGFFEGSAIVHWHLVLGASETLRTQGLKPLCQEAITLHQELLDSVSSSIRKYAAEHSA